MAGERARQRLTSRQESRQSPGALIVSRSRGVSPTARNVAGQAAAGKTLPPGVRSPDAPPCWVCGTTMRREVWRAHYTRAVIATVHRCPRCGSSRDVGEAKEGR